MTTRPTPEQAVEKFIAAEVGYHTPAMADQATALLDDLRSYGFVIVHPDDVATVATRPDDGGWLPNRQQAWQQGWNDCRRRIFSEETE